MKIGILTYTREYANLGTVMQAYCTQQAVRAAYPGAQVELIDYAARPPAVKPYLSQMTVRSLANDLVRIRKYRQFFAREFSFTRDTVTTPTPDEALQFIMRQQYDAIYVGSDTVLELKDVRSQALTPYWLDSSISATRILASASALNVTYESLSTPLRSKMQRALDRFALLGARDHATFRLLSHFIPAGDDRLQMVPDPTFTYDIDYRHIDRYLSRKQLQFRAPVVCLHLVRNSPWAPALARLFRKAGYLVASLRPAHYADMVFNDLSPFEQMGLYRSFALVITHRFHDTIFSLKNLTPVIAFPERSTDVTMHADSKLASLLRRFGLEDVSYMPPASSAAPESFFERYPSVLSHFRRTRPYLERCLAECRRDYYSFITTSRQLVH